MTGEGRLVGRHALVTGGSRGIGAAIVRAFAREGADLAFCHLGDGANAKAVADEVEATGRKGAAFECDIAAEDAVEAMVGAAEAALGGIDILVNNAGITGEVDFADMSIELWDRLIAVDLRGTFLATRLVYPAMCERGWGRIINVSSAGFHSGSLAHTHYCAAKGGLVGFTRALALEAAPKGVLVNCIVPGPVETELFATLSPEWQAKKKARVPLGRFGTPDEIAPTAVMLGSEEGSFYVGQTLSPNGGTVFL